MEPAGTSTRTDGVTHGSRSTKVVILGAGFAGMWAARTLGDSALDVVLVDQHNYHTFYPLLYQVAAAELTPGEIAQPVRSILRHSPNVDFCLSTVQAIDLVSRTVTTNLLVLSYDYLIIALGSTAYFFGVPGAAEWAYPLKSVEQALSLRNHILTCFEEAEHDSDHARRERLLTFTVVGGGPTGVEFAGALAELIHNPLVRDFPRLKGESRILVLEGGTHLLTGQPLRLQDYARDRLQKMGVQVRVGARVVRVEAENVQLQSGEAIQTDTVIWTAGVYGTSLAAKAGLPTERNGQVAVLPTLQAPEHPEVYIVGDLAHVQDRGRPIPLVAQPALQEGTAAARNVLRQVRGEPPLPFRYRDLGTLAVIGRNAAVADVRGRQFTGFVAWLVWLVVHIYNLIGFRNRVVTLVNWAWDYFFFDRGIRLILPSSARDEAPRFESQPANETRKAA